MFNMTKEQHEEIIRKLRNKSRIASECEHEGKICPMSGCEFCGERIVRISHDLYERLQKLEEFKEYEK